MFEPVLNVPERPLQIDNALRAMVRARVGHQKGWDDAEGMWK